jgi:two-component sensor histidine kinase
VSDEDGKRMLDFLWEERGGPTVKPPTDGGFGSQLVLRAAEYDLAGSATLDWAPEGLTCALRFPLE